MHTFYTEYSDDKAAFMLGADTYKHTNALMSDVDKSIAGQATGFFVIPSKQDTEGANTSSLTKDSAVDETVLVIDEMIGGAAAQLTPYKGSTTIKKVLIKKVRNQVKSPIVVIADNLPGVEEIEILTFYSLGTLDLNELDNLFKTRKIRVKIHYCNYFWAWGRLTVKSDMWIGQSIFPDSFMEGLRISGITVEHGLSDYLMMYDEFVICAPHGKVTKPGLFGTLLGVNLQAIPYFVSASKWERSFNSKGHIPKSSNWGYTVNDRDEFVFQYTLDPSTNMKVQDGTITVLFNDTADTAITYKNGHK